MSHDTTRKDPETWRRLAEEEGLIFRPDPIRDVAVDEILGNDLGVSPLHDDLNQLCTRLLRDGLREAYEQGHARRPTSLEGRIKELEYGFDELLRGQARRDEARRLRVPGWMPGSPAATPTCETPPARYPVDREALVELHDKLKHGLLDDSEREALRGTVQNRSIADEILNADVKKREIVASLAGALRLDGERLGAPRWQRLAPSEELHVGDEIRPPGDFIDSQCTVTDTKHDEDGQWVAWEGDSGCGARSTAKLIADCWERQRAPRRRPLVEGDAIRKGTELGDASGASSANLPGLRCKVRVQNGTGGYRTVDYLATPEEMAKIRSAPDEEISVAWRPDDPAPAADHRLGINLNAEDDQLKNEEETS